MPRKLSNSTEIPTLVQERLTIWGRSIRTQRLSQRMMVADLCARMGISEATLRRLEQGDPGAAAGTYLTALLILGIMDDAAPPLDAKMWGGETNRRVRHSRQERGPADADYF